MRLRGLGAAHQPAIGVGGMSPLFGVLPGRWGRKMEAAVRHTHGSEGMVCRICQDRLSRLVSGRPDRRDPTPTEIGERAAEIQAEWTEATRRRRLAVPVPQPLEVQVIRGIDLFYAVQDAHVL